ncbi:AraC family transcriptional regulator [Paraburkholderia antibiotica]|uniref:AraC family transcriptional regulator n=1 Tax=Paraburkholderia antibiotica TaxID=2728839 RepID=UPI002E319E7B|nr:AraC family transcriptional regulator [Paraburkholderia antibiotica]
MAQHTISILQVDQILQGARRQNLAVDTILRRAGIAPELLDSPLARVTQAQYAALIRALRRATRDEIWGLCSRPLRPGTFVQLCRLLIHCRTLGDALRGGFEFLHLMLDDAVPRLVVERGIASVRWVPRGERDSRLAYADRTFCFFTYGLASWLVARRIPVQELMYRPIDAGCSSDAERLFKAPVNYGHPWVGFRFEARWLDLPVVQTPQSLGEFLHHAPASLLIKYRDQSSLSERIRRQLRRHLAGNMPSLEAVSESLSLTPQTLRRHLREEGQSFQAIKDELRRDAALEYLSQPELTLLDIASRLGFSEASTFHRAFKGWTGLAPGLYRQTRLQGGEPVAGRGCG